mmetsp:Transcript_47725/g.102300  ORF Transcript_47725/g.102300 Transcript_47725/m.102300 type:complete len:228 (+) Transcript_47725:987-1670(+)
MAVANTFTIRPWMWKRGIVLLQTSSAFCITVEAMHWAPQVMFECVKGTIFGFFVVPEVWSTKAKSSRFTDVRGLPSLSPFNGFPAGCFVSSKRPAISFDGVISSNFSTFAFRAVPMALPVDFKSSSPRLSFCWTTSAFAGKSINSNSNSSRLKPMLRGAKQQRRENAKKATAASGPLGMAVQRRSSRFRPSTSTLSLIINSFKALKVSGFLPSMEWMKGLSVSGNKS